MYVFSKFLGLKSFELQEKYLWIFRILKLDPVMDRKFRPQAVLCSKQLKFKRVFGPTT